METRSTPMTRDDKREIRNRGLGLDSLWRTLVDLFVGLCVLIPVLLFLVFLPLLAQMLTQEQMTVRSPAGMTTVDTRDGVPAPR